jgi:hypothetical protein
MGRCTQHRRDLLDRVAQVVGDEVPVGLGREPHVPVPHDPLDVVERDARPEQQRRRRVPEIVEAHRAGEGLRPEAHPARGAASLVGVQAPFRVSVPASCASTADVLVPDDHAGPRERVAQDLPRVRLGERIDPSWAGTRARSVRPPARRTGTAGAASRWGSRRRARPWSWSGRTSATVITFAARSVRAAQPEQLPLAHARVDRRGEDVPP